MELEAYHVDAFTSSPFSGNPAAVVFLPAPLPDSILSAVAREFNLSETAFVCPLQQEPSGADSNASAFARHSVRTRARRGNTRELLPIGETLFAF